MDISDSEDEDDKRLRKGKNKNKDEDKEAEEDFKNPDAPEEPVESRISSLATTKVRDYPNKTIEIV